MSTDSTPRIQPTPDPGQSEGAKPGETFTVQGGTRAPKLPHERDESSTSQHQGESQDVIEQAAKDMEAGLQDTSKADAMDEVYQRGFRDGDDQSGRGHHDKTTPSERAARRDATNLHRGTQKF